MQPQALDRQVLGPKENGKQFKRPASTRRTNLAILVFWYFGVQVFLYLGIDLGFSVP